MALAAAVEGGSEHLMARAIRAAAEDKGLALTRADVGIAIGGGTDVAVESAGLIDE